MIDMNTTQDLRVRYEILFDKWMSEIEDEIRQPLEREKSELRV